MDVWGPENTYRHILSRDMISGGFARSPEAQKYFNDRLKSRGAQATKLYNPMALGRRIRKALTAPDFGKFDLAQKLERLNNIMDTADKVTLVFDSRSSMDLVDSLRSTLLSLAPTFTVSEAQNTFETLTTILKKGEAMLSTAYGKDFQHLSEADSPFFDPGRLTANTRKLTDFVSSLRKLTEFVERVYAGASSNDERQRSRTAVAAAEGLFSRTELGSSVKEAEVQLKKWGQAAEADAARAIEEEESAEAYADQLEQQMEAQEGFNVPAFQARETAAAAQSAAAQAAPSAAAVAAEAAAAAVPDEDSHMFPFTDAEIKGMNDRQLRALLRKAMIDGAEAARELAFEDGDVAVEELPSGGYLVPKFRNPQTEEEAIALEAEVERLARSFKPKQRRPRLVIEEEEEEEEEEAPAAGAPAPPTLGPGSTKTQRNDYIKYQYYIRKGLTQNAIKNDLISKGFPITQATISRVLGAESKGAYMDRTGYRA
jgi:chemotaxis protein histidine kinase CheA